MAIKHSENFIKEIAKNTQLRKSLYRYHSPMDIMRAIEEMGYGFEPHEFEESINHLKTEAPHEEQAIMLGELLVWWKMLMGTEALPLSEKKGCTPSTCGSCSSCP